jgi:FAD/FMN-containing dehydrogenase
MPSPSAAPAEAVAELAKTFLGRLLQQGDPDYEEVRKVHNGLVDKRPALIAQCRGVADIVDSINFARTHSLEVAVRGAGHNVDEPSDPVAAAYGLNYRRLRELKTKYDPANFFHMKQNIRPA